MINCADINSDIFDTIPAHSQKIGQSLIKDLGLTPEKLNEDSQKLLGTAIVILLAFNLLMTDQEFEEFDKVRKKIHEYVQEDICANGHTV